MRNSGVTPYGMQRDVFSAEKIGTTEDRKSCSGHWDRSRYWGPGGLRSGDWDSARRVEGR